MSTTQESKGLESLDLDYFFGKNLLQNLPYMFWMYEKIDGSYKLIKWNENQEIITGFSKEELWHMNPFDFFETENIPKIEEAITEIFDKGSVEVFENLKTKSGELLPFYFEGYKFDYKDYREIFVGVSVDVSELTKLKTNLHTTKKEKKEAQKVLERKERELLSSAIEINRNNDLMNLVQNGLDKILDEKNDPVHVAKLINDLKKAITIQYQQRDDWEIFKTRFNSVHKNFFNNLQKLHPELSKSEQKFCAYLKINLSNNQISSILNISKYGIKQCRYRIRKKVKLDSKKSLEKYIDSIG